MPSPNPSIAIIGAGSIGVAAAYYLALSGRTGQITLIDQGQPMAFTSAQSGENYRDWWPHDVMVRFMGRSIDLMERIALESDNRIAMKRRGYVLATRRDEVPEMIAQIERTHGPAAIRVHEGNSAHSYQPPKSADWQGAPDGFDILQGSSLIQSLFPNYDPAIRTIVHVRRGGDISGQQLGQHMLERIRGSQVSLVNGMVSDIRPDGAGYALTAASAGGSREIRADMVLNAAGPFAVPIAQMLGQELPLYNVIQQKISFPDTAGAIPRDQPFSIDLDGQMIDWSDEERALIETDEDAAWLTRPMPGAIHCRPDGSDGGNWVKLGWAYNEAPAEVSWNPPLDARFPEIVLRGAARLNPGLRTYYGNLPRRMHHYGGYYTRTDDNWPLIGPMDRDSAFMAVGLSGHGTMAACATGELIAAWMLGDGLPDYAQAFTMDRFAPDRASAREVESGLL